METLGLRFLLIFRLIVVVVTLGLDADEASVGDDSVVSSFSVPVVEGSGDEGSGSLPLASAARNECRDPLQLLLVVHAAMLVVLVVLQVFMARLALRGTIWDTQPRSLMEYILYSRLRTLSNQPFRLSARPATSHSPNHSSSLLFFVYFLSSLLMTCPRWTWTAFAREVILIAEMIWSSFGIVWLHGNYATCPHSAAKEVLLGNCRFHLLPP